MNNNTGNDKTGGKDSNGPKHNKDEKTGGKDEISPKDNNYEIPDGDKKPAAKENFSEESIIQPQVSESTIQPQANQSNTEDEKASEATVAKAYRNPHPLDSAVPPPPAFTPSLLKTPAPVLRTPAASSYSSGFVSSIVKNCVSIICFYLIID